MAVTPSTMLPLGTPMPTFSLPNPDGNFVSHHEVRGAKGTVVMFICNHCPFVIHVRKELGKISEDFASLGIGFVGINSNDIVTYPQDGPEQMKRMAAENNWRFPYLLDADQDVAKAFRAACTPDFFVFNAEGSLVYRGQMDSSRPGNGTPVTGSDLVAALRAVLAGGKVSDEQMPSMGCNIKWKKGNAPDYF